MHIQVYYEESKEIIDDMALHAEKKNKNSL